MEVSTSTSPQHQHGAPLPPGPSQRPGSRDCRDCVPDSGRIFKCTHQSMVAPEDEYSRNLPFPVAFRLLKEDQGRYPTFSDPPLRRMDRP